MAGDEPPTAPAAGEQPLVCPGCAREYPSSERFCAACGMPLVQAGAAEPVLSERQRKARKIKPQYAEGELVQVAHAENLAQGEFIAGILLEEGIPSLLCRSPGFAPMGGYAVAVGPRDVLVPESGAQAAREALAYEKP